MQAVESSGRDEDRAPPVATGSAASTESAGDPSTSTGQGVDDAINQRIFETTLDLILVVDHRGRFIRVSPSSMAILGYRPDEMFGRSAREFLYQQDLDSTRNEMRAARYGRLTRNFECRYIHKEGRVVPLWWTGVWSEAEQQYFFIGRDITVLKAAQQALADREASLNRAQRLAHLGSICVNLRTEETDWSDEVYRIFGVSRDTFVPSRVNYLQMVHPDDRATVDDIQKQVRQAINPQSMEYRIIRLDGTVRQLYRESEVIRDEAGLPLYVNSTIQDITERRQTEEQLQQAQKMEAIGNLTGGMAHDFNNMLGIIIGNLELLRDRPSGDPDADELSREALEAAFRGADLTRRLLAFARRQPLRPARTDVNALIAGIVKLLERTLGEQIQITLDLNPDTCPVVVDPAQLESSLTNLATNARDAMPLGGELIIVTGNRSLDEDYASQHAEVQPGDYALIEVSDSGTGMDPEIASHVFEPFYTTKEEGKGTGLGLSMVFGFIKQSGGHINVYSEVGIGTTFRLYLPRAEIGAEAAAAVTAAAFLGGRGETVLAVEDNVSLRSVVVRQLKELGYRVLEAEDAQTALRVLENEPVDVLFTDIVMPGRTSGYEIARTVLSRWPTIKVVLTSGFPDNKINGDPNARSLRLLSKPYRRDDLGRLIREALDS
jgi:PAS domain S-box-containing protein